jgi:uncharacterized protein
MDLWAQINPLYSFAGLLVGILVGLTGVGGGSLMTPLLVLLFGFHPATAVGTDLLYASVTKSVGTAVHGWRDTVDWRIVRRLASGSVPAAAVTLSFLHSLGAPDDRVASLLTHVLGIMLLFTSVAVLFQKQLVAFALSQRTVHVPEGNAWPTLLLGAVLGVLVSISSIGAGAIGVTALLILYPHAPINRIIGSDIAHAVPLTLVAGTGHWMIGNVDTGLLVSLLIGSVPGVILGSYVGSGVSDRILRPLLAAVLILVGAKLLF